MSQFLSASGYGLYSVHTTSRISWTVVLRDLVVGAGLHGAQARLKFLFLPILGRKPRPGKCNRPPDCFVGAGNVKHLAPMEGQKLTGTSPR